MRSITIFYNSHICAYLVYLKLTWYCFFSIADIQNARGIMDVLAEMLNALDPKNKEVFGQLEPN